MKGAPAGRDTPLSIVLKSYFVKRTDHKPSAKPARDAGARLLTCWGPLVKVGAIDDAKLLEYAEWAVAKGHSLAYIAGTFGVLATALRYAGTPVPMPRKPGALFDKWPHLKDKPTRRVYEPTDEELARLLRQDMPESLRRWILNSMATVGRPMAVAELRPAQRERAHGLINLNPAGRRQNKKFRPTVREPKQMTEWLDQWEKPKGKRPMAEDQRYCPYASRSSIKTALGRACAPEKANIPKMALYSFRHRATTVLRSAGVPKEQIDYQQGHIQEGARTTQD